MCAQLHGGVGARKVLGTHTSHPFCPTSLHSLAIKPAFHYLPVSKRQTEGLVPVHCSARLAPARWLVYQIYQTYRKCVVDGPFRARPDVYLIYLTYHKCIMD